jgi:hypothetical protein
VAASSASSSGVASAGNAATIRTAGDNSGPAEFMQLRVVTLKPGRTPSCSSTVRTLSRRPSQE